MRWEGGRGEEKNGLFEIPQINNYFHSASSSTHMQKKRKEKKRGGEKNGENPMSFPRIVGAGAAVSTLSPRVFFFLHFFAGIN